MALFSILFAAWTITIIVEANIVTILQTSNCSKAVLSLAKPRGLYHAWHFRPKAESSNVNRVIQERCGPGSEKFVSIDYHYKTRTFFIANAGQRVIEAYDFKTKGFYRRRVVFQGVSRMVKGVAVDWVNNNVYWADPAYDVIMMTTTDGSCQVLECAMAVIDRNLDNPNGLAVHPLIGKLFWTNGLILESASLDGKGRKTVMDDLHNAQGLCIDYNMNRLYWIDRWGTTSYIQSCDFDGAQLRTHLVKEGSSLFDLDIYKGFIIMTDDRKNEVSIYDVASDSTEHKIPGGKPLGVVIGSKDIRGQEVLANISRPNSNWGVIILATRTGIYRVDRNFADTAKDSLKPVLALEGTMRVHSLTSDAHTNYIYFYDDKTHQVPNQQSIQRVKLNVGVNEEGLFMPEVLTNVVNQATDLAIDWITKNLYWTDKPNGQIMVSRDTGKYPTVVLERHIEEPRTVVIDPVNKYIFWGDGVNIGRAELDGSDPRYSIYKVMHGNHRIAVDPKTVRVYFNDYTLLCYGDYLGQLSKCQQLSQDAVSVISLDIINDYVIYSAAGGGMYALDTSGDELNYVGGSTKKEEFYDIAAHHVSHQPMGENKCTEKTNGGCEQLCLPNLSMRGYTCACTVGYWVRSDGSCKPAQLMEPYLLFSDLRLGRIYQSSLLLPMYGMYTLQSLQMPLDVAYDNDDGKVFWTDGTQRTINSAYVNGTYQQIVFANVNVRPRKIAVDTASKLVYFVDHGGHIGAVSLVNGAYHKILDGNVIRAEDIALDPERGLMFITGETEVRNLSGNSTQHLHCITMAHMDGTNLEQVVLGLGKPKGIIVYKDRVIWADAKYQSIEEVRLWTWNRTVLVDEMRGAPIDLTAYMDHLYWTETGSRCILRSNMRDGERAGQCMATNRFFSLAGLSVASGEIRYSSVCVKHQCREPYGLCIPTPKGAVCKSPAEEYIPERCVNGRRRCNPRERYMQRAFCRVPFIGNGTVHDVTPGSYVPINFKIRISCDPGFKWARTLASHGSERYISLKPRENICLSSGAWAEVYVCQWDMSYQIEGTLARGIIKFHSSTDFLVPLGVWSLDVICIGGGGGGYSEGRSGGRGEESSFDRAHPHRRHHRSTGGLRASGGHGGHKKKGGHGGFGYRYRGGDGGSHGSCKFGGAVGQIGNTLSECKLGVTFCPFCGAGGYGQPEDCSSATCTRYTGACSGPWAKINTGLNGSNYGGGAGSIEGGSGGAGGFSRKRWMRAKPGSIVPVRVGNGGSPSSAPPGDGIVIVAWGDKIENFLSPDSKWKGKCLLKNPECSCIQGDSRKEERADNEVV